MSPDAPILVERYELHRSIASGGMATVYLGRRRGDVGFSRVVAIKRMHPHLASEGDFVEMFLDEARLASRIRHPNVVPIVDLVATDDEVLLVMEYVAGIPLDDLLDALRDRGERVPISFALRMLSDALHGLDAAHNATDEHGGPLHVVHRDVSPQNLLVGADGSTRLIDFGIAKAAGRLHKTRTGQTKGKVGYMPPEQMHGERLDARSDLYALGLTFWEVLVGERAIDGESEAEIMHRAMTERIAPPIEQHDDVPESVSKLIMRAIQRERSARFPSAEAMAHALDASGAKIASPRALATWLMDVGGEQLDERAEWVARVERGDVSPEVGHLDTEEHEDLDEPAERNKASEPERDTASMSTLTRTVERAGGTWRTRAALGALLVGGLTIGWWSGRQSAISEAPPAEPSNDVPAAQPEISAAPRAQTPIKATHAMEPVPSSAPTEKTTPSSAPASEPTAAAQRPAPAAPPPAPSPRPAVPTTTSSATVPDHLLKRH